MFPTPDFLFGLGGCTRDAHAFILDPVGEPIAGVLREQAGERLIQPQARKIGGYGEFDRR
jgi:hypothetical protein